MAIDQANNDIEDKTQVKPQGGCNNINKQEDLDGQKQNSTKLEFNKSIEDDDDVIICPNENDLNNTIIIIDDNNVPENDELPPTNKDIELESCLSDGEENFINFHKTSPNILKQYGRKSKKEPSKFKNSSDENKNNKTIIVNNNSTGSSFYEDIPSPVANFENASDSLELEIFPINEIFCKPQILDVEDILTHEQLDQEVGNNIIDHGNDILMGLESIKKEPFSEEIELIPALKSDDDKSFQSLKTRSRQVVSSTKEKNIPESSIRRSQRRKKGTINSKALDVVIKIEKDDKPSLHNAGKNTNTSVLKRKKAKNPPLFKTLYRGEMVYKCNYCEYYHPTSISGLRRHLLIHRPHDEIEWFYCEMCNFRSKRKGNLSVHMLVHRHPEEVCWYKCDVCDKQFKLKSGLYEHKKRHKRREDLELYLCDQCSYKTPFKHTLLRHKITHDPPDETKLMKCQLCPYNTYNKYNLWRHRKTHEAPTYKCLLCNYTAKFKINLESHMIRHNPNEELFYCTLCDFLTNRRYTLTRHNKKVHLIDIHEEEIFYCYNCSYKTKFKRCLVKHMTMHQGVLNHQENIIKIKTEKATN